MLQQNTEKFAVPPKIKFTCEDLELVAETVSYKVFEGKSRYSNEKHRIRILDNTKDFVKSTMAKQLLYSFKSYFELFRLLYRHPGSILINSFKMSDEGENGKHLACAILPHISLSSQLDQEHKILDLENSKLTEKLISDVLYDIQFLWKEFHMRRIFLKCYRLKTSAS